MTNIIRIAFNEDLPTKKQNELKARMELARWKEDWRIAESMGDWVSMSYLNWQRNFLGG
jgi:hypothetical protein